MSYVWRRTRVPWIGAKDELVGCRLSVAAQEAEGSHWDPRRVQGDLGSKETARNPLKVRDRETGSFEHRGKRRKREKPEVSLVEKPRRLVIEVPLQKGESDGSMGHVRKADDKAPARRQMRAETPQERFGLFEMFEHVTKKDDIEAPALQLRLEGRRFHVGDHKPQAELPCCSGEGRVLLDGGDFTPLL